MLKTNEISSQHYRDAMAHFAGAVHIVTTDGAAGKRGVTAIAACSVSDQPPTILVCLNRLNPHNEPFLENGVFALNTLSAGQRELSDVFSGMTGVPNEQRFDHGEWETLSTGSPVLKGSLAVLDCELVEAKDMATHRIYFGRVTGIRIGDKLQPLLYHDRKYRVLAE